MSALILFQEDDIMVQSVSSMMHKVESNWQQELIDDIMKLNEEVMLL